MANYLAGAVSKLNLGLLSNYHKSTVMQTCSSFKFARPGKVRKSVKKNIPIAKKIECTAKSLSSRGFLRNIKPFHPPKDASTRIHEIFENTVGSTDLNYKVGNIETKYNVLSALSKEFNYTVPNSYLHEMKTLGDILDFYITPVENINPYDRFKNMDLPRNLHIMYEYVRFNPETDTKFGGKTAFPKRSVLVTGLKAKTKYKGFYAGNPFHDI